VITDVSHIVTVVMHYTFHGEYNVRVIAHVLFCRRIVTVDPHQTFYVERNESVVTHRCG
jgi:hypothetical protein